MKPTLTVFTPTFNRAYTLHLCYESLKRQTSKDFIWLIIDDGSTDQTKDLVESWKKENRVPIHYHYQENQGMHGAHNTAYSLIETELNVCIDSDDYMSDQAVERIVGFWREHGNKQVTGIVGLDATFDGQIIGTRFPNQVKYSTLTDLYQKYKVKGDKKLVYRSELTRKTPPYPIYEGEKYCPLAYKYILIDQEGPLLVMNEILCHVEYLVEGSSMNIIHQYKKNPRGFSLYRITTMNYSTSFKGKFRASIHYVSSNIMIKNLRFLEGSPNKLITMLATPFGLALYLYIQNTKRPTVFKGN